MKQSGLPKTFSGATTASVIAVTILAAFLGGLAILALATRHYRDITLPAVGAAAMAVLALGQLRIMRNEKR